MSNFSNITRPRGSNVGGVVRILCSPVDNLVSTQIRVQRGTGYVNQPIQLKAGKNWLSIQHQPKSLVYSEKPQGDLHASTLNLNIGKDTPELVDQLDRMRRQMWVVLVQTQNNEWLIVGTPTEPCKFYWEERKPGKGPLDYNGYNLVFSVSRRIPAPFYRVYATFYIDENGFLVFDNTFDPSLSISLNEEGELSVSGPNQANYTINADGFIIFTG
jgi:hypothetical protein